MSSSEKNVRELKKFLYWYFQKGDSFSISVRYIVQLLKSIKSGYQAKNTPTNTMEGEADGAKVVFVFPSNKSYSFFRQKKLIESLSERLSIETCIYQKEKDIVKNGLLQPVNTPLSHYVKAGYAKYLVNKYRSASLIIIEKYDPVFQFYLMLYRLQTQAVVHLAHSKITNDSKKFSINLCDYYFVFGESSIQSLKRKKVLIGSSDVCETGAYFSENRPVLFEDRSKSKKIVLIGMGPLFEKKPEFFANYQVIDDVFCNDDFQVVLKPHTMSDINQSQFGNILIAPKDQTMEYVCKEAFAVISIYSNAIMDAAYLGYPVIYFNSNDLSDEWFASDYFGVCSNEVQLKRRIDDIANNYLKEAQKSAEFGVWHFGQQGMGSDYIANLLACLALQGKKPPNTVRVESSYRSTNSVK